MDESRDILRIGAWQARRSSGELHGPDGATRLEPKVAELLFLLGSRPNEVVTREEILESLWPDVVVGEDTLARLVFKLRRALDDDPKAPRFVETLPKRGYRLRLEAPVEEKSSPAAPEGEEQPAPRPRRILLWLAALALLTVVLASLFFAWWPDADGTAAPAAPALPAEIASRATDFYFQYSREDNEAAIELFERLVGSHPDYAPAYSGLANALVQRVMRWPTEPPGVVHRTLRTALEDGHMELPAARRTLERAEALARQAVALAPGDAEAHKALGLVRSTQGDFAGARAAYRRAIGLDADAWGAMINMGDVLEIEGRGAEALPHFEASFAAMTRVYSRQVPRVQPWYAELATGIGERHLAAGRRGEAESWFRRALEFTPLHPAATRGLARVLRESGDAQAAERLCGELRERLGAGVDCG